MAQGIAFGSLVSALAATIWLADRRPPPQSIPADAARAAGPLTLQVEADTRLLLIAPHPDDDVLGAGGLLQHVRAADGTVRVVYLTDGEGYRQGVRVERHEKSPTVADYRAYGHQRADEARAAMRILGVGGWSLTFLGFPNGGLNRLMTAYWSPHRRAYRSEFTRRTRPLPSEALEPGIAFRGEDLTQELAEIIGDFKPTMIVVPRPEDQHVDHCAAWFFVADALGDVQRTRMQFHTDVITYIVHYNSWPFDHPGTSLPPPEYLDSGVSEWLIVPLDAHDVDLKRAALHAYKSQMDVMGWFLDGFARTNEVFARPATPHVVLPLAKNVCDEFIER